ncbi:heterogeneous nuclear ribonucleoprotein A1-like [Cimex lectularius]|uniref:RRM domain-containing protein n=1 Tax=Cimex lectularius TaxID=79782 RepID=A0A8I6TBL8_CIMLE|nr:heterogeneous nuclear ribonucleoprotein A1-like [Cimex lectularius]
MGKSQNDNNPEGEQFRKLFIGGLDYRTTDQSLKSFYEQWGEIVDVVVMKHPQTQKSRGFGFVTYAMSSMVDEAMKNRPHKIDGRQVDSKRAVPRDESSGSTANVNVKKMFVGGLKEQSEADLREYFGTFGTIVGINIVMDKATGNRKGFAFIEFDDYDPVDKALLRKDHSINGKGVTVKKAVVKDNNSGSGRGPRGLSGGRGGGGGGGGGRGQSGSNWNGNAGGNSWGGTNGYGSSNGPWDAPGNGWSQSSGGQGWQDQSYGGGGNSGWNGGYQQGYGGGPMRNNYNTSQRTAPYGGGYGGGSSWNNRY